MTSYIIYLHRSPIAWSTWKQSILALSTAEAEYIALTSVTQEGLVLPNLVSNVRAECHTELPGIKPNNVTLLYELTPTRDSYRSLTLFGFIPGSSV